MMCTENCTGWAYLAVCALCAVLPGPAPAANAYIVRSLTSDIPDLADYTDPNLIGPVGIAESSTSPFWISDSGSGLSTLYNSTGSVIPLIVEILPIFSSHALPNAPTGIVYNGTAGFAVTPGNPASFIFATLDGTINGWNQTAVATVAETMVNNSESGRVYTGLAIGTSGSDTYLYAANLHGTIDVFDSNYNPVTLPNAFQDANIPAGYAPFNIQNLAGNLYVTYALTGNNFVTNGAGDGYVDVYSTAGSLMDRLIAGGNLNTPWGLAIASSGFGDYAGDLLVGNFGDGTIMCSTPPRAHIWQR
jgi:uncharacterized protein (TIGR03118 family)